MRRPPHPGDPPAPLSPVPWSGESTLRVRYTECDPMGLAHHASYVPWLEIGRTDLLRASGVSYAALEAAGVFLVVTHLDVHYRRPARYDDRLLVLTRISGARHARIDHAYEIWRLDDADGRTELIAQAASTIACVGPDGRPRPLPEWLGRGGPGQ